MQSWSDLILVLTLVNFVAFMVVGVVMFDSSHAGGSFRVFAGVFVTLTLFSVGTLYFYPTAHLALQAASLLGLSLSLVIFVLACLTTMRRPFTVVFSPDMPTRIVTYGIYRYMRHPFYTAYVLTFVAVSVASTHLVPAVCAALTTLMYTIAAILEENKFARSELAVAYREYRGQTGMFFPWRSRKPAKGAVPIAHPGGRA